MEFVIGLSVNCNFLKLEICVFDYSAHLSFDSLHCHEALLVSLSDGHGDNLKHA
jgi:hypothetical protein